MARYLVCYLVCSIRYLVWYLGILLSFVSTLKHWSLSSLSLLKALRGLLTEKPESSRFWPHDFQPAMPWRLILRLRFLIIDIKLPINVYGKTCFNRNRLLNIQKYDVEWIKMEKNSKILKNPAVTIDIYWFWMKNEYFFEINNTLQEIFEWIQYWQVLALSQTQDAKIAFKVNFLQLQ